MVRKTTIRAAIATLDRLIWFSFLTGSLAFLQQARSADLQFHPGTNGTFQFDTGLLRGVLRSGGKSDGLMSVVHIPTGTTLHRSKGLFGIYRVFTTNKRYGHGAWDWESTAELLKNGAVKVHWAQAIDRPFEMWATYRWKSAESLDLEVKVKAHEDLPAFEAFVASYFDPSFSKCFGYAKGELGPAFVECTKQSGTWQAFPRDDAAVKVIQDGRWTKEPSPVDWAIRPFYATPIGLRRAPQSGLAAAVFGTPKDCFAVLMPEQDENHRSLYLSLFGRDIKRGKTDKARARLEILTNPTDKQIAVDGKSVR